MFGGRLFIAYQNTAWRRQVLASTERRPDDYILYGLSEFRSQGWHVEHNLEMPVHDLEMPSLNRIINYMWHQIGGYGGDWYDVFRNLTRINRAHLVFCTSDRFGIPLVILKHLGLVVPRILYLSIGLPERLEQLKGKLMARFYKDAFRRGTSSIICFGFEESECLQAWLGAGQAKIHFMPYAVDTDALRPRPCLSENIDVITVGADIKRDVNLIIDFAMREPGLKISAITRAQHAPRFDKRPSNLQLLLDVPFHQYLERLACARVVMLPVLPNTYSGATSTLLQAMSLAKPIVVSAVGAISNGYALQDGVNCMLVPPGDGPAMHSAVMGLLTDGRLASNIGFAARQTAMEHHSWSRFLGKLIYFMDSAFVQ